VYQFARLCVKVQSMRHQDFSQSTVQQRFAANMRRIRKEKSLTQEQVAEFADLHPNYISSVERAERNISLKNIERIAFALDVPMSALMELN
jgi:transcriptional regulator with XRE-family HTH domain